MKSKSMLPTIDRKTRRPVIPRLSGDKAPDGMGGDAVRESKQFTPGRIRRSDRRGGGSIFKQSQVFESSGMKLPPTKDISRGY